MRIKFTLPVAIFFTAVLGYETVQEAAIIARKLVARQPSIGSMATVYPPTHQSLPDQPFSLPTFYANCFRNGSLTLLLLPISRHTQNIFASPGHHASISVNSEHPDASRPRVSLLGTVSVFKDVETTPELPRIKKCYLAEHPDATKWLPGDDDAAHRAYWARFDPRTIYFVGGFGDEHYIGYIPQSLYQDSFPGLIDQVVGVAGRILVQQ